MSGQARVIHGGSIGGGDDARIARSALSEKCKAGVLEGLLPRVKRYCETPCSIASHCNPVTLDGRALNVAMGFRASCYWPDSSACMSFVISLNATLKSLATIGWLAFFTVSPNTLRTTLATGKPVLASTRSAPRYSSAV